MMTGVSMSSHLSLRDLCKIGVYTVGAGTSSAEKAITYPLGSEISCGVKLAKSKEVSDGSQATMSLGDIMLPLSQSAVVGKDRIYVTKYDGVDALSTPEVYAILGEPLRMRQGFVCNVQRLTGGSAL